MQEYKQDVLMVGVGGQGTILASDILGEVAIAAGYDVKKTDTLGMAQRGGSVISHIRIADIVRSPLIKDGEVDFIIAFEKLEAARWSNFLRSDGLVVINNQAMPPLSVALGNDNYPSDKEILDIIKQRTDRICLVDGTEKVLALGDIRTLNIFMLGYISGFLPFDLKLWQDCITARLPQKILDMNIEAFEMGRKETSNVNI